MNYRLFIVDNIDFDMLALLAQPQIKRHLNVSQINDHQNTLLFADNSIVWG